MAHIAFRVLVPSLLVGLLVAVVAPSWAAEGASPAISLPQVVVDPAAECPHVEDPKHSPTDSLTAGLFEASSCCTASCDHGADVTCCGTTCSAQDDPDGFCMADGGPNEPCPPPPVSVSGVVEDCVGGTQIGERATYTLKCTASGGTGSYSFSWSVCSQVLSDAGDNPNRCRVSTVGSISPKCTATSGGDSDSHTFELSGLCLQ